VCIHSFLPETALVVQHNQRFTGNQQMRPHYEHRSWTAWHRHMRLVFLAQLFLLRLQIKFKKKLPP
jgi:SRSO17 transposase